eukprot:5973580-Pyramimonas_sp.AAC.1
MDGRPLYLAIPTVALTRELGDDVAEWGPWGHRPAAQWCERRTQVRKALGCQCSLCMRIPARCGSF